jgi:hypothetical protein
MTVESKLRLLVALDSRTPDVGALRLLARLGDGGPLDVTCLFVEDEDLARAAALPGLREVSLTGQVQTLDPERIAREVAADAEAARQAFARLAAELAREHRALEHRFLVTRGRLAEEFHRAAAGSDLVMVTRALRTSGLRPRLGRSFLDLVREPKPVLFVNEPWASGSSVVVLGDGPETLARAGRLAEAEGLPLVAVGPAGTSTPDGVRLHTLPDVSETSIAEACQAEDARLLVVPARADIDWPELLVSLLDRLPCSVLKLPA